MAEPYAHVGVGRTPVHEDERPGLTCDDCQAHLAGKVAVLDANFEENWAGLSFAAVPGGASGPRRGGLTPMQRERKFQKDMDAYSGARKNGLRPEQTNKRAVEKAEKREYARERVDKAIADGKIVMEAKNIGG